MKLSILFFLVCCSFSCNIENPVYGIVLSDDVYASESNFIRETNPLIERYSLQVRLHEMVPKEQQCFIKYVKTYREANPKASLYSYSLTDGGETEGYIIAVRGTTASFEDLSNDYKIFFDELPPYVDTLIEAIKGDMPSLEENVRFYGHSLGGYLSNIMGYLYQKRVFALESPGMRPIAEKIENKFNKGSYVDYHLKNTVQAVGLPNVINSTAERIESKPIILFFEPLSHCISYRKFIKITGVKPLSELITTILWQRHYHARKFAIYSLLVYSKELDKMIEYDTEFDMNKIMVHPKFEPVLEKFYSCQSYIYQSTHTYEETKEFLLSEKID